MLVTPRRLHALTSLRFVAAAMIVCLHLTGNFGVSTTWAATFSLGQGVTFFFILSGFILTYVYPTLDASGARGFLIARFARLWPAHLATFGLVFLLLPAYLRSSGAGYSVPAALTNLGMVHAWLPVWDSFLSFNSVSWSISTELALYLCFPLLIRDWRRTWLPKLACSALLVVGMVALSNWLGLRRADPFEPGPNIEGMVYIGPIANLFLFSLGMATCLGWRRFAPTLRLTLVSGTVLELAALALAIWTIYSTRTVSMIAYGAAPWIGPAGQFWLEQNGLSWISFPLLIFVLAMERGLVSRLLSLPACVLLGEMSYSVYLVHQPLLRWSAYARDTLTGVPNELLLAIFWLATLSLSWLLWRVIERPSRRLLVEWLTPSALSKPARWRRWRLSEAVAVGTLALALVVPLSALARVWPPSIADGTLIRLGGNASIFVVEDGRKRPFLDWDSYLRHGGTPDGANVLVLSEGDFAAVPQGVPIPSN
jgi:peptidoglycan/LPS O-acetylase OafA/YrhL